jgi:hypothetical protein
MVQQRIPAAMVARTEDWVETTRGTVVRSAAMEHSLRAADTQRQT